MGYATLQRRGKTAAGCCRILLFCNAPLGLIVCGDHIPPVDTGGYRSLVPSGLMPIDASSPISTSMFSVESL